MGSRSACPSRRRSLPTRSPSSTACCCVPGCWRDEAIKRKADELTKRFEKKGVSFRITSRLYQGWAGEYEQNLKSADFLVVTHELPSMAEMEMAHRRLINRVRELDGGANSRPSLMRQLRANLAYGGRAET